MAQLGATVQGIRSSGQYIRDDEERRQLLDEMGFVWQVLPSRAEKVRAAHAHYERVRIGTSPVEGGAV